MAAAVRCLFQRDICDARIEGAAYARDLLEHDIADAVRRAAQLRARGRYAKARDLRALVHVQQAELDFETTVRQRVQSADDQVFHAQHAPVLEIHLIELRGPLRHVLVRHGAEAAAAREIVGDRHVHVHGQGVRGAVPAERCDRDRQGLFHALRDPDVERGVGL